MSWLALHGFTGSPASFARLSWPEGTTLPALGGHLRTPASPDFETEVERLSAQAPHARSIFGYSLGGRLALGLLARFPTRFERAVLVSAQPGLALERERRERRAGDGAWVRLLRERGLEAFVDAWEAQPLWSSQAELSRELRLQKRAERLQHDAEGLARSLESTGLGAMPDLRAQLRAVRCPVDILVGAYDTKFVALGEELRSLLPRARMVTVAGAGHDLLLERPEVCSGHLSSKRPA